MAPFYWPHPRKSQRADRPRRFFAYGGFFTPDGRARAIATPPPPALSHRSETGEPLLCLNTGRVRDHWHTMTRTASSAQLSAHLAEPYCEISPRDAEARGVSEASLVQIENDLGSIIVRALITDRVRDGEIFVPIHWTDQVSANARVDTLVPSLKDPFSGQPASKSASVSLRPAPLGTYGFAILRERPHTG